MLNFNKTNKKYCCICGSKVKKFNPYKGGWRDAPPLMMALNVIGSDLDNFSCPTCGAHDRERHLYLYFQQLQLIEKFKGASVLHFAPEPKLSNIIEDLKPAQYNKADLFPAEPSIEKIDITSISYENERFDIVIANHVLEHVFDDMKALSELYRVLKIGGLAVLQTPYSGKLLNTFQDSGIDNDYCRLHSYGQEDHVRLYGLDIFNRFASVGFKSQVCFHDAVLTDIDSRYYGINKNEPFFLFLKN